MLNKKKSLCCISLLLQKKGFKSSTMTKKRFLLLERQNALYTVGSRTLNNIVVSKETMLHCIKNNWNYRISSDVIPLITLPEANISLDVLPQRDKILEEFKKCSDIIKFNNLRCSTHPDQFVVPASLNENTSKKSVIELNYHADVMDMFGLPQSYNAPINIHMNCYKGCDLKDTAKRFIDVFESMNDNVKKRLVLENEDKPNSWSVRELYDHIFSKINIPITYDNLHHKCNDKGLSAKDAYNLAKSTWGNYIPLFHFSDSEIGSKNPRAHADYVHTFAEEYNNDDVVDLEFEFKAKDLALKSFEEKFEKVVDSKL